MARLSSRSKYVPQVRILLNKCKMCLPTRLLFQATNTQLIYIYENRSMYVFVSRIVRIQNEQGLRESFIRTHLRRCMLIVRFLTDYNRQLFPFSDDFELWTNKSYYTVRLLVSTIGAGGAL